MPELIELLAILAILGEFKSDSRVHLSILTKRDISPQGYTTIISMEFYETSKDLSVKESHLYQECEGMLRNEHIWCSFLTFPD